MSARPKGLVLLLAATQLLPALAPLPALASSRALPELPRRSIDLLPNAEPMKDKRVAEPEDPGIDCVREVTAADKRAALDADYKGATGNAAKNLTKCLPQHDSFRRAGEAASYLGHYYTNFTPFAAELRNMKPDERAAFHDSIRECVQGHPSCDAKKQQMMLKALVQYNFGKELRAQVLENNARAERMKTASADLPAQYWREHRTNAQRVMTHRGALKTGSLRTTTFRLNAKKDYVFEWSKATQHQKDQLGSAFMDQYREFMNTYSQTTQQKSRWHYVSAKSSALMGSSYRAADDFRNQDPKTATFGVNRERHDADQRSQNTQKVNEIVHSYKDALRKDGMIREVERRANQWKTEHVAWTDLPPNDIMTADTGLGLIRQEENGERVDPKLVAQGMILSINKAIVDTEDNVAKKNALQKARVPAGNARASGPKVIPTVMVDVEKFDKFLDAIWPADVAKP